MRQCWLVASTLPAIQLPELEVQPTGTAELQDDSTHFMLVEPMYARQLSTMFSHLRRLGDSYCHNAVRSYLYIVLRPWEALLS